MGQLLAMSTDASLPLAGNGGATSADRPVPGREEPTAARGPAEGKALWAEPRVSRLLGDGSSATHRSRGDETDPRGGTAPGTMLLREVRGAGGGWGFLTGSTMLGAARTLWPGTRWWAGRSQGGF